MSPNDVLRLETALGDWQVGSGPRYRRLADAITRAAQKGTLDGMRLPAERRLADHLGVSRTTVVHAYAILRERGVASSRQRSGTVVRSRGLTGGALAPMLDRMMDGAGKVIDLSFGAFPLDALMRDYVVSFDDADGLAPAHGYVPQGLPALREAIAERYRRRGVPATAEDILITSGAQEAISLLAAALAGRNQDVLVEQTTFSGALAAFIRVGASVRPVIGDVAGIRPDHLAAELRHRPVALAYLVPNCHNPTGGHLAVGRRERIVALASDAGVPIIEDCALDELRYDGPLDPLLQTLNPKGVFGVGALSKLAWGGLRVGWIRGPRAEILRLTQAKGYWNISGSILDQLMALRVLADHDRVADARRRQALGRLDVMTDELTRRLPEWQFDRPEGGVSLWVRIPGSGEHFAAVALRHGVAVGSGRANVPGDLELDHLRLCFVLPDTSLREAVDRLHRSWASYRADAAHAPQLPVAV